MRCLACISLVAVLSACAEQGGQPANTADSAQMAAPAAGVNLADIAGTWNVQAMPADRDTVLVSFQMIATADQAGWQFILPDRPPIPVQVLSVDGDSVVTHAGPFESVLRPGQQVETHTVFRVQGGTLNGTIVARYPGVTTADSVTNLRITGTKGM
jgi:hypothetical protein